MENQRRTRYFSLTSNPEWNQTMVYPNLQPADLAKRHLEVTAWNYQPDRPNEFLGEVVLDLSGETILSFSHSRSLLVSFSQTVSYHAFILNHSFIYSYSHSVIYSFAHAFIQFTQSLSPSFTLLLIN